MDEPFSALDVLTAETLRTDLLDLWSEGRIPIKAMLMVTHNIEEAVLMCDRILVFSSNPGRIAAEIAVPLPHPRNRLDPRLPPAGRRIYALMTQRPEREAAPAAKPTPPGAGLGTGAAAGLDQRARRADRRRSPPRPTTATPTCRISPTSCSWRSTICSPRRNAAAVCASPNSPKATSS